VSQNDDNKRSHTTDPADSRSQVLQNRRDPGHPTPRSLLDIELWQGENDDMRTANIAVRNEAREAVLVRRWFRFALLALPLLLSAPDAVVAQTSDSQAGDSTKSWTATTDSQAGSSNPMRTFRSHTQSGDRTMDVQHVQTRGPDGKFVPYQDIETETVKVSATVTRTTTRTYVQDGNGAKTLFQVSEEETQTLPGGDSKSVRTSSNPDANGNLQVARHEVQETRKTGADAQDTKTTVLLTINGSMAPAIQVLEHQTRSGDTVEIKKTTLLPDGTGKWEVGEVRQTTVKDDGKVRRSEEQVSRPDSDGKLSEVSRTVGKESVDGAGEKQNSQETYSVDVQGMGRESSLHLVQRVATTQHTNSDGQQTITVTEQPNPGNPGDSLRVITENTDTVRAGPSGTQAVRTIQMRDGSWSHGEVFVDMSKSNKANAIEVQVAPPKAK
jgi:hypothetical protein